MMPKDQSNAAAHNEGLAQALSARLGAHWIWKLLAWGYVALILAYLLASPNRFQQDFFIQYDAARVYSQGLDPYSLQNMNSLPDHPRGLFFSYPPIALYFYSLFIPLSHVPAYYVWMTIKLCALAGLFFLWNKHVLPLRGDPLTIFYFILAFNGTLFVDLWAGNLTILEQLAYWLGFACLIRGRIWPFSVLIILVAQVKLTPVCMLGLLLVMEARPKWLAFFASLAGFFALFSANFLLFGENAKKFYLVASQNLMEHGINSPSTLALYNDVLAVFRRHGIRPPVGTAEMLFAITAVGVLAVALWTCSQYHKNSKSSGPLLPALLICLVYVLVMPRFKNYMFIYALMPALYVLRNAGRRFLAPVLAVLLVLPNADSYVPIVGIAADLFHDYLPLLCAYLVFAWFVVEMARPEWWRKMAGELAPAGSGATGRGNP